MLDIVERWAADPSPLLLRAAIARACEPSAHEADSVRRVFDVLDLTTGALASCSPAGARSDPFQVLRPALAYSWERGGRSRAPAWLRALRTMDRMWQQRRPLDAAERT